MDHNHCRCSSVPDFCCILTHLEKFQNYLMNFVNLISFIISLNVTVGFRCQLVRVIAWSRLIRLLLPVVIVIVAWSC
jgi:hypothetical protein